jgi:hypothetical protein
VLDRVVGFVLQLILLLPDLLAQLVELLARDRAADAVPLLLLLVQRFLELLTGELRLVGKLLELLAQLLVDVERQVLVGEILNRVGFLRYALS